MITAVQIIGGLLLLFVGGEILVRGAVALAKDLGLSTFVIGLTVVAYGTSSPEMVISVQAALASHPDIALGNVIGSNISNILCVIGLTAIVYPVIIEKKLSVLDGLFMLAVTILLYLLCTVGVLNFLAGAIFLMVLIVYTYLIFNKARKQKKAKKEDEEQATLKIWQAAIVCTVGIILLMVGGDTLIKGAVTLATLAGLSEATIGVTLVAFGGSVPELVTSLIAAFHKRSEIVFGNIIGSNLFNILGILGVTSIVRPIDVGKQFLIFDLPVLLLVTLILFGLIYYLPKISRKIGIAFFIGYVFYVLAQFSAL